MDTVAAVTSRQTGRHDSRLRRVTLVWALLIFNVLTPGQGSLLPIPHRIAQIMTEGSLFVALVLALSINPRMRMRPNWFLGLYTVLAISSLMMSVRLVGIGTDYRTVRLIVFLFVLWLLTPWWGRRDLFILRSQVRVLTLLLGSVVLGLCISPGKAMMSGRLTGTIWPIVATGVAHYGGEIAGLTVVLWICRLVSRRHALLVVVPALVILVLSHTRTALLAMVVGLVVAGASLFVARRRVRRTFVVGLLVVVVIGVPAAPVLAHWGARGENAQGIRTLTGRTTAWSAVLAAHRPTTNRIFGDGLSNGSVEGSSTPWEDGLSIDDSWLTTYQDQGIVGVLLLAAIFVLLLLTAIFRARGPTRALALFLIVYLMISGIAETGLGDASPYLLDMAVVGSLITLPSAMGTNLTFGPATSEEDSGLKQ